MRPRPLPRLLPAAFLAAVLALSCGRDERPARAPAPGPTAGGPASDGVAAARPDTSRAGPAFLAVYRDGPLDELRVVRATDGGLVVAGQCQFPDGARVGVTLLAPAAAGAPVAVATTKATVTLGRFMSTPLAPAGGPPPPGLHLLRVTATFGPGDQDPEVLRASDGGRRLRGAGVHTLPDGRVVYETTLEVPL